MSAAASIVDQSPATSADAPSTQANPALLAAIDTACARIAPTWPLDQFIAVNPYWGWVDQPIERVAAQLGSLGGTRLTMPREWFREQWQAGTLQRQHLEAAVAAATGTTRTVDEIIAALTGGGGAPARLPLVTDLRDAADPDHGPLTWTETVTHQVSQHCAAWFDDGQASWRMGRSDSLYGSWRRQLAADRGLAWTQGRRRAAERLGQLPQDAGATIEHVLDGLGMPQRGRAAYLTALLLSINGWAAWCAYRRWQARLGGHDDHVIVELLAIRAAWDWLLHGDAEQGALDPAWQVAWSNAELHADRLRAAQEIDWLLQDALEIAYRQPLAERLLEATREPAQAPKVQAVFCIDVRSEVFRRNLESAAPHVHTRGFAGFFGLPIAYSPLGSALTRPQLPGLLSPAVCVTETCDSADHAHALEAKRRGALQSRQRWSEFRTAGSSTFSFVESLGITYGAKLLKDSLASTAAAGRWEDTGLPASAAAQLRPRLPQVPSDPRGAAVTAKAVLQAMGLVRGFAPLVLLAGHGSQSANNPHASGLDCGACCGQTGEVNARALADLLNAPAVRAALREAGVDVPDGTHFLPGLHNTTTDEVVLYDVDAVPAALRPNLAELQAWLAEAGRRARAERAPTLGLGKLAGDAAALEQAIRERSNDWAQVRPEWGLADNAAFVVAPRARTRHLNLGGRSFLHDYDHREDPGLGTLELILTAPMVVINWINMQYHASTVDNRRYGSGNKVLHNVVGGHIGVFEGNGGDLRIGLPMQSLHDGRTWRHTPLRMNVFVEAPRAAIETIAAKHPVVRNLVDNGWLHLMRIDPDRPLIERFRHGAWTTLAVH